MDTNENWITQEAYDRLQSEMDSLIANRRKIAIEINERREEGDLKENGGYHAARELQGQQEARIRYLQNFLNNAKIGSSPKKSDTVIPGMLITVSFDNDPDDIETFLLANREELDKDADLEVYSPASPIGEAILNKKINESTEYLGPNNNKIQLKIIKIEPFIP